MRALIIEGYRESSQWFMEAFHEATRCSVNHARSLDEGLIRFVEGRGAIDIVIYEVEHPKDAWGFPQRLRSKADQLLIRRPCLMAIAANEIPLPDAIKCLETGTHYLLRDCPRQIFETARVIFGGLRKRRFNAAIRVEFHDGHYLFYVCDDVASEQMMLGSQLGKLALILAQGCKSYSVDLIAQKLGISRQSVKKYMHELGVAFDYAREELDILESGNNVFWMERRSGGSICGLAADVIWA